MISCEPKNNTEPISLQDRPRLVTNLIAGPTRVSSPKPLPSRRASSQTRPLNSLNAQVNAKANPQANADVNTQAKTPVNTQAKAPLKSALRSRSLSTGEQSTERRPSIGSALSEPKSVKQVRFILPDDHVELHKRPKRKGSPPASPRSGAIDLKDLNAKVKPRRPVGSQRSHSASREGSSRTGRGSTIETIPEEETLEQSESSRTNSSGGEPERPRRKKKPQFNPRGALLDLSQIE